MCGWEDGKLPEDSNNPDNVGATCEKPPAWVADKEIDPNECSCCPTTTTTTTTAAPGPLGACCCHVDNTCVNTTEDECNGTWTGGGLCEQVLCAPCDEGESTTTPDGDGPGDEEETTTPEGDGTPDNPQGNTTTSDGPGGDGPGAGGGGGGGGGGGDGPGGGGGYPY